MGIFRTKATDKPDSVAAKIEAAQTEVSTLQARMKALEGEIGDAYGDDDASAPLEIEYGRAMARINAITNVVLPKLQAEHGIAQGREKRADFKRERAQIDEGKQQLAAMRPEIAEVHRQLSAQLAAYSQLASKTNGQVSAHKFNLQSVTAEMDIAGEVAKLSAVDDGYIAESYDQYQYMTRVAAMPKIKHPPALTVSQPAESQMPGFMARALDAENEAGYELEV